MSDEIKGVFLMMIKIIVQMLMFYDYSELISMMMMMIMMML